MTIIVRIALRYPFFGLASTTKNLSKMSFIKDLCKDGEWVDSNEDGGIGPIANVCKLVFLVSLFQYVLQTSFKGDV